MCFAPTRCLRPGPEVRLIVHSIGIENPFERVFQLVDLIVEAHAARGLPMASRDTSIQQLAKAQDRCRTNMSNLIKLS